LQLQRLLCVGSPRMPAFLDKEQGEEGGERHRHHLQLLTILVLDLQGFIPQRSAPREQGRYRNARLLEI